MESFKEFYEKFVNGELSPTNSRRKLLTEAQYVYPSSGDKAIMDVYALYALWWEIGGGRSTYGYQEQDIRNHKVREKIDRYFEEALVIISNILLQETKDAIADEADNIFDNILFTNYEGQDGSLRKPMEDIVLWFKKNNLLPKLQKAYNNGEGGNWFNTFDYNETIQIFSAPFWEHANLYGGKKWAVITEATKQLDNAVRREKVTNLLGTFDKFMDLEHNTGSLYSKLKRMKVSKQTLDLRAGFRTPQDFLPYVSDQVKKLIGLIR
jgi:hypothetical protein